MEWSTSRMIEWPKAPAPNDRLCFRGSPFSLFLFLLSPSGRILYIHHKTLSTTLWLRIRRLHVLGHPQKGSLNCKTIKCSKAFFALHLFIQGYLHICINKRNRVILEGSPIGNVAWWQKKNCQSISPASFLQGCWHDNILHSLSSPAIDVLSHNSIAHCPCCPASKYYSVLKDLFQLFQGSHSWCAD